MSAAKKVFGTWELSEQILLNLPLRQLLLSQRINKICHNAVQTSKRIQQALFLAPASEKAYPAIRKFSRLALDKRTTWHVDGYSQSVRPLINPFLTALERITPGGSGVQASLLPSADVVQRRKGFVVTLVRYCDFINYGQYQIKFRPPTTATPATWENMLWTHPPCDYVIAATPRHAEVRLGPCLRSIYEQFLVWNQSFSLSMAKEWVSLAADIDEITGFEMLEMMSMSYEEMKERDLRWPGGEEDYGKYVEEHLAERGDVRPSFQRALQPEDFAEKWAEHIECVDTEYLQNRRNEDRDSESEQSKGGEEEESGEE